MMILRKACVYRLFTNETGRYDTDPGHRYFCLSCQQLTANQYEFTAHYVDCSRSLSVCQPLESNNNAYSICILQKLLCPLINMFCMHCRWKCIVYFLKCDVIYSSRKHCADYILRIANRRRTRLCNSLVSGDSLCATLIIPCIGIVYYA